ncbi:MAG: RagB/SusD family nutrient uptake outer membrane protein [Bacteroidetes bacterium]|nr:RagB/SusD family nutrient uptake outer membrane protein [Bacteroidota bacterium]
MKKNIFTSILILLTVLILFSCKEEFLDVKNDALINSGSFPARLSDIEKEIGTTYGFRSGRIWNFPQVMASYGMEHFMFDGKPDRFPSAMTNGLNYNVGEPELWGENLFALSYDNIKRENSIISDIERYMEKAPESEKAMLDVMLGEAYVSRAVEYFYLAGFYGEAIGDNNTAKGMILIDKIATNREETFKGRSTVKETYEFIIADLQKAVELMGNHEWQEGMKGRFTGIGAKHYWAKYMFFWNAGPTQLKTLGEVINDPKVKLASNTSLKTCGSMAEPTNSTANRCYR